MEFLTEKNGQIIFHDCGAAKLYENFSDEIDKICEWLDEACFDESEVFCVRIFKNSPALILILVAIVVSLYLIILQK